MNFFTLGSKFSSFEALKAALIQYKKETHVEFFIRDCKTLERSNRKRIKSASDANAELIYHRLKLYCIRGGRRYISASTGLRKRTSLRLGCQAYIYLTLSHCKQYLEVKDYDFEHNHELTPRPLQRTEARAEKRRKRVMEKLNISYAEVLHMERLEKNKKDAEFFSKEREELLERNQEIINDVMQEDFNNEDFSSNQVPENEDAIVVQDSSQQIFTRTGDDGMSATFNGERLYKDDKIFEAVGTVEELSSAIGFAVEFFPISCHNICNELREIQCVLQDLAIHVGTPKSHSTAFHRVNSEFPGDHVTKLENQLAKYTERLPKLNAIILPSGGKGSSALHVARSVCRRAERRVACLLRESEVDQATTQYLNRLGDYLFAVARIVCICDAEKESIYEKPKIPRLVRKLYIEPAGQIVVESEPYKDCEVVYITQDGPETTAQMLTLQQ